LPEGGELGIAVTEDRQSDAAMIQITIRDSGEGIPEDVLANIFEPFFTTRTKGTGLGLAIVKRIIDQHGGTIDIQSEEAKGTSITFTLPTVPVKT
jgi:signal transduction histidine kinase